MPKWAWNARALLRSEYNEYNVIKCIFYNILQEADKRVDDIEPIFEDEVSSEQTESHVEEPQKLDVDPRANKKPGENLIW